MRENKRAGGINIWGASDLAFRPLPYFIYSTLYEQ